MTVDASSADPGEPGLYQVVTRALRQLRSSATNGAVSAGAFEDAAQQMRLTPDARERVIGALAAMGLQVVTPEPNATVIPLDRAERALALVRRHIPAGHVTREQLNQFGRLAGLDATEIASLPERAEKVGIAVLDDSPAPARPEPATTPGREAKPAPEPTGPTYDFPRAVAAARRLINDDRFRADPGRHLLSATEEAGLSILLRGGVDRVGAEPTDDELSALPADDIRRVARNAFVLHNTRLVHSIVLGFLGQGLEEEDLAQHGTLGLIRATRKFDPRMGHKFSTYATWWIRQSITRAIADEGAAIRIPVHVHEKMRKVAATESALRRAGKPATAVDVALASGLDVRAVDEIRALSRVTDSLDRVVGDGVHLGDFLSLRATTAGPEEMLQEMISEQAVQEWLGPLSDRQADILCRRLGLNDDEPETLEQIASHYGVTRERIRQIEAKALTRLREQLSGDLCERPAEHPRKNPKKRRENKRSFKEGVTRRRT